MTKVSLLVLLALSSCAIDDRKVKVSGACVTPPAGGLISDFSAARRGICPAGICSADLVGKPTVSLGVADVMGLIFPYSSPGPDFVALDVVSTMSSGDAASGQALRAEVNSRPAQTDASVAPEGFALYLIDCLDVSAYSGVSFTTGGNLGGCPLRFAVQLEGGDAGTFIAPCSIDECHAAGSVPVAAGTTTLTFPDSGNAVGPTELAGLQWEVSVPSDHPGGCTADFAVDDIRLVSKL
jgi:hypothetical protein